MQSPDRLTRRLVRDGGELRESDWEEAMEAIVGRSRELLADAGPAAFAFYTTGQLFLEEYYTLAVVARAGIGTNHVDGNTRLCTATADEALKQTFGCDGQPASYADVDHCGLPAVPLWLLGPAWRGRPRRRRSRRQRAHHHQLGPSVQAAAVQDRRLQGGSRMKIGVAIDELADAEAELSEALLEIGERHKSDHDVYHLARQLARWAQGHLAALEPFAERYGGDVDRGEIDRESGGPLAAVREKGAELLGRRPEPALLLLRDLRELHLRATRASLGWTVLGQAAQAATDAELLECVSACHPETLRTMRWSLTKLKEASLQALVT